MEAHNDFVLRPRASYLAPVLVLVLLAQVVFGLLAAPGTCWAWGSDGHQIIGYIAADHLTPVARRHVAQILGVADNPRAVADAMARAAIRPDIVFRTSAPETIEWHFLNLCRQDTPADEQARCPNGACLTDQIDRFVNDLRSDKKDGKWDSAAQLAFVINFMGEIHQPMHAITNADMGGKCVGVIAPEPANALHALWGERLVTHVEHELHTRGPANTAAALQRRFPDTDTKLPSISEIAWESHQLAESQVYKPLGIPMRSCQPTACIKPKQPVKVSQAYLDNEWMVVARQLATGGYRLAALLNAVWKD
ncbi:MAG TPA: S1/P1 nuclease [Candidatus Binataceae bacterium]|nr:S1/P1 nuclease [Candidatus Binataceae bacterium]